MERIPRNRRGLSLLEISISTSILSLLVFAAASSSRVALLATSDVNARDAEAGSERRTSVQLRELLLSASQAELEGVPAGQAVLAEPMQDDVDYQELRFRRVVGFVDGALTYEPPMGAAASRLFRAADPEGDGALVLETANRSAVLLADVRSVNFRRAGAKLTVTITYGHHGEDAITSAIDVVLRVP